MPVILVYSSSRSNWACGRRLPSSQRSKGLKRLEKRRFLALDQGENRVVCVSSKSTRRAFGLQKQSSNIS